MGSEVLDYAKREMERLTGEIVVMQQAITCLIETREAWAVIVRNAKPQTSLTGLVVPSIAASADDEERELEDRFEAAQEDETDAEYGWKTKFLRDVFVQNPQTKFTPAQIWKMVQEEKVSNRRGFVYQGLSRMHKKTGLLLKRSGKYYASPKLLAEEFEAQTGTRATEVAPAA